MRIIGITGLIGSGKSTVAATLAELGAAVIDADEVGHLIYAPGTQGWKALVESFGTGILTPAGEIDRPALARIVFSDASALSRLNKITHPLIAAEIGSRLAGLRRRGVKVAVVEAALLIEAGWVPMMDEIWVTTAPRKTLYRRLREKQGLSLPEARARMRTQLPVVHQLRHASREIDTDTSLPRLRERVGRYWISFNQQNPAET
jgi:dephospho-CoA kinase